MAARVRRSPTRWSAARADGIAVLAYTRASSSARAVPSRPPDARPIPFALTQSATPANTTAGGYSPYTFNLSRADGQQYLSQVSTTLPAGLLGDIPSVTLCGEPQAAAGTCAAASQIGVASVTAGAGTEPYPLSGPVYLTGPYDGAPYGLSIPVSVIAGPFNLGTVVTRATIKVNPHTARVTVHPRVRRTAAHNCGRRAGATEDPESRSQPAELHLQPDQLRSAGDRIDIDLHVQRDPRPVDPVPGWRLWRARFQTVVQDRDQREDLETERREPAGQPHPAGPRGEHESVFVELPKQLPSRLTTLQKACPEATFAANPVNCRALGSEVGSATVVTPVLPGQLSGSAYLVSHGGESFPDLDIVLEGDGVKVILTGNTKITKGVTSSTFAAIPDVPVTSFVLNLPSARIRR